MKIVDFEEDVQVKRMTNEFVLLSDCLVSLVSSLLCLSVRLSVGLWNGNVFDGITRVHRALSPKRPKHNMATTIGLSKFNSKPVDVGLDA